MSQSASRYVPIELLGRGGMGAVYKTNDTLLGRTVAMKVMTGALLEDIDAKTLFIREARSLAALRHPYIVDIFDFLEMDGQACLVMEYIEGKPLDRLLREMHDLTVPQKVRLMANICEALDYAHSKSIIHRDLKPANVLVLEDGTPKLVDFGIAKIVNEISSQPSAVMGTVEYMSPEQFRGEGATYRSDIFSAGVLFYEVLTGATPFKGADTAQTMHNILRKELPSIGDQGPETPQDLQSILERATQKDANARYGTAGEFAKALLDCLQPPLPPKKEENGDGRFVFLELIGQGGMGTVHKAMDTRLGRIVAIKVMSGPYAEDAAAMAYFAREARSLAALQHPLIVPVFDFAEIGGEACLIMEYVDGTSLEKLLRSDVRLSISQKLGLMAKICEALDHAHRQGVIHRDLKPANVLVVGNETPRLIDFGIAKIVNETATGLSALIGTVDYMAPERFKGEVTNQSDIFSAGVLFYQILTGRLPFRGADTAQTVNNILTNDLPRIGDLGPEAPTGLQGILVRATQKDPRARYVTAGELAAALLACERSREKEVDEKGKEENKTARLLYLAGKFLVPASLGYTAALLLRKIYPDADDNAVIITFLTVCAGWFIVLSLFVPLAADNKSARGKRAVALSAIVLWLAGFVISYSIY